MALTTTEETLVRQLLNQQAAILSLASNEATITSKLGATKVTLADLVAASSLADADLLLTRQGTSDKSLTAALLAQYCSEEFLAGITTPPQFDNTTKTATTAFVQRALGNYAGQVEVVASRSLLASESGSIVNANGTITVTLPVSSGLVAGLSYQINNAGSGVVTVNAGAADNLYGIGNETPRSFVLGSGDSITVGYVGGARWYAWGGLQLGASAGFGSSLAASGYQKLPSRLIIQWGVAAALGASETRTVTLPITFPAGAKSVTITGDGATPTVRMAALGTTTFQLQNLGTASQKAYWVAFGY